MENNNNELCSHGCGQVAKFYSKNTDKWRCTEHSTQCPELKKKNSILNGGIGHPQKISIGICVTCNNQFEMPYLSSKKYCSKECKPKRVFSKERREKISKHRIEWLKQNPDKNFAILHKNNKESYAEKYFREVFENNKIPFKQWLRFGPYELDFYNEDFKIDFEVDGNQHLLPKEMERDKRRDEFTSSHGWKVIRILWSRWIKKSYEEKQHIINDIKGLFEGKDLQYYEEYKSRETPKSIKKKQYCNTCSKEISKRAKKCKSCTAKNRPKKIEISKQKLQELYNRYSLESIGRFYNVSSNCIKDLCKSLEIPLERYKWNGIRKKIEIPSNTV